MEWKSRFVQGLKTGIDEGNLDCLLAGIGQRRDECQKTWELRVFITNGFMGGRFSSVTQMNRSNVGQQNF
jgi:hypothetical protein